MKIQIESEKDLSRFAARLAPVLRGGMTLGLIGPLGAGKTTFVRHLMRALGSDEPAASPSFVLQHLYQLPNGIFEHWDIYRLPQAPEDLLEPPAANTIRCIEWCDKDSHLLSALSLTLTLEPGDDPLSGARTLILSSDLCRLLGTHA